MTSSTLCPACHAERPEGLNGPCVHCGLRIGAQQPTIVLSDTLTAPIISPVSIDAGFPSGPTLDSRSPDLGGESTRRMGIPVAGSERPTDSFTLIEELGRGGMGVILRGRDRRLHRDVAIKVLRTPENANQRERFVREAQVTGQLEHPTSCPSTSSAWMARAACSSR